MSEPPKVTAITTAPSELPPPFHQADDAPQLPTPVAGLSILTLIAGIGGMAISFVFLASSEHLDVLAGAAGFLAGAVLVAGGLVSLAVQGPSGFQCLSTPHIPGCLMGLLPPLVTILAGSVLYLVAFPGGLLFMPLVMFACTLWAWELSDRAASDLAALLGGSQVGILRVGVFLLQLLGILASWILLDMLLSMWDKIGWS